MLILFFEEGDFEEEEFAKAESYLKLAIQKNCFKNNNFKEVLSLESLNLSFILLTAIYGDQYILYNDKNALKNAQEIIKHSFALINFIQNNFSSITTRLLWQQNFHLVYEQAILIELLEYEENQIELAKKNTFSYAELSKSTILQSQIQESNALHYANIPDSLLQQEYDLRIDITYYDKKRQEKLSQGAVETDTSVLTISSKLFDLNQTYDNLKARFEKDYPEYFKLKYDLNTITVKEVQQDLLEEDQALVEYFVGDSSIFIFLVKKDDYKIVELNRDSLFGQWVEDFRNSIGQPFNYLLPTYADAAYKLYEKLLAPIADQLPERLIIIPDGLLGYIPFEAILTEKPKNVYETDSFSLPD